jgi:hypothetical protein
LDIHFGGVGTSAERKKKWNMARIILNEKNYNQKRIAILESKH